MVRDLEVAEFVGDDVVDALEWGPDEVEVQGHRLGGTHRAPARFEEFYL